MSAGHQDSGQNDLWKDLQQRIEAVTGPSIWPVPAGLAVGAGLLGVVALSQPPDTTPAPAPASISSPVSEPSTARPATSARKPDVPRPAGRINRLSPKPSGGVQGLLLPPRPGASDVTRRIESGLPRRAPSTVPQPKAKPKILAAPPEKPVAKRPQIAIVIDDMGFDRENSARAVRLPPQVTLAYLPYAPSVRAQVRHARLKGHPVILHLPMEAPEHRGKPGYNVLAATASEDALREQLARMLGRFGGYTGVNNHMGSVFTRNRAKMDIVVSELRKRGLFFLDSRTSGGSVGATAAAAAGIPYAVRDVFLDHEAAPAKIRERLAETEAVARRTGQAIAIGHPRDTTMDILTPWVARLKARGFDLVRMDSLLVRPAAKKLAQVETPE